MRSWRPTDRCRAVGVPLLRDVREARARLADLGRISLIQDSCLLDWLLKSTDDNWRVDSAKGGPCRTIGDIGPHGSIWSSS